MHLREPRPTCFTIIASVVDIFVEWTAIEHSQRILKIHAVLGKISAALGLVLFKMHAESVYMHCMDETTQVMPWKIDGALAGPVGYCVTFFSNVGVLRT
jgi:hypothetical protein